MSRKNTILISITALFFISMAYTNCSPVHEGESNLGSIVETVCTPDLEAIQTSIFDNTSCATCHGNKTPGAPQFRNVTFNKFLNVFAPSGSDVRSRTVTATNRVITRLNEEDSGFHKKDTVAANNIQSDLTTALNNFDACEATSAAVNE